MAEGEDTGPIDAALARGLVERQFPRWAGLAVAAVSISGTDNAIFRLGEDKAVRLPRLARVAGQAEKEWRWLPRLAPALPLAVPTPLALGAPDAAYPWPWTVCRWVEGEPVTLERLADPEAAARDLAGFLIALRAQDAAGGPRHGAHNFYRGQPLSVRAEPTRAAISRLADVADAQALSRAWEACLEAPAWDGPPMWIHGDLHRSNLLARDGRLCGVIDFGGLGVGDPACDLMVGWSLFEPRSRAALREALAPDEASWARGRGWALWNAIAALDYYRDANPTLAATSRHAMGQVLAEFEGGV
jgi:aminoglycoside phosphotransferase (APT) family kinase protein